MSELYVPYPRNVSAFLEPAYSGVSGIESARMVRVLHVVPDGVYSYDPAQGKTISGTVAIAGTPIPDATVILMSEAEDAVIEYGRTNSIGQFAFDGLNSSRKFYVIAKLPTGWETWEYMVSSRRNPV